MYYCHVQVEIKRFGNGSTLCVVDGVSYVSNSLDTYYSEINLL